MTDYQRDLRHVHAYKLYSLFSIYLFANNQL